jgi:hypothetical protein
LLTKRGWHNAIFKASTTNWVIQWTWKWKVENKREKSQWDIEQHNSNWINLHDMECWFLLYWITQQDGLEGIKTKPKIQKFIVFKMLCDSNINLNDLQVYAMMTQTFNQTGKVQHVLLTKSDYMAHTKY